MSDPEPTMSMTDDCMSEPHGQHLKMKLSVIIPVLNERHWLPKILAALSSMNLHEVIVVDGGSTDGSREWLSNQPNVFVINAERGRGNQLRTGARIATGDVLVFLHSDCILPLDAPKHIIRALVTNRVAGGCFLVRFAENYPRSLPVIALGINCRTLFTRTATGDQSIFVRRAVYETIGGFAVWPLFEDLDLVRRIKGGGRFVVLPRRVTVSARRWIAHGVWRTTLMMYALRIAYYLGVSPFRLKRWFDEVRTD